MLQYFTKNFFYPLIITGRLTTSENLEIFAILDALEVPSANLKVLVRIFSWNNLSPLVSVEFPLTLVTINKKKTYISFVLLGYFQSRIGYYFKRPTSFEHCWMQYSIRNGKKQMLFLFAVNK